MTSFLVRLRALLRRSDTEAELVFDTVTYAVGNWHLYNVDSAKARARETNLPLAYVNQVGGQDELVFDGRSFVMNRNGDLAASFEGWHETVGITDR